MRILYISNEYPPETGFGGIATYTGNTAMGMAAIGNEVHVICRAASGKARTYSDCGVTVHRIPPGTYPLPQGRAWYFARQFCYGSIPHALVRLAWAKAAYNAIFDMRVTFDIIEYPECGAEGYYLRAGIFGQTVARLHTPWWLVARLDTIKENPCDTFFLSRCERASVRRAGAVTSPSQSLASIVNRRWGIHDVTVIPNPIPVSNYTPVCGNDWIFTGRVEQRKGVHVLIAAYADLSKSVDLPLLRIVGRPYGVSAKGIEYGVYIEGLIKKFGLENKIDWIKGVEHESVKAFLAQSSVAVFPSLWENLSYGCLEAMASGCAVVASRCGGFPELVCHGENGLLFSPGNACELAQALYKLLCDRNLLKKLGENARQHAKEKYDTGVVCRQIEDFYKLLRNGGIRG
jgi:glycogen(starch) synthase